MYPKLRAKYGDSVTYADSPATHVIVEFSFDVVQAAGGGYVSDMYQSFIGFQVAKPVLERAFLATYGLEMKDVFLSEDLAIGSYRHAVSQTIPGNHAHRLARQARGDPEARSRRGRGEVRLQPVARRNTTRRTGPTTRSRVCWRASWRSSTGCCRRSVRSSRCSSRRRRKKPRRCFSRASRSTRERFRAALDALGRGRLDLPNTDFDTGKPSAHGEYSLADETYAELLGPAHSTRPGHGSGRAAPEHQRVLCGRPEPDVRAEGAQAREEDQRAARAAQRQDTTTNAEPARHRLATASSALIVVAQTTTPSRRRTIRVAKSRAKSSSCVDDDQRPLLALQSLQQRAELGAALRIERRGRLVHQQHRRIDRERARDRDALRLAARQLARQRRGAMLDAERAQQLAARARARPPARRRARAPARGRRSRSRTGARRGNETGTPCRPCAAARAAPAAESRPPPVSATPSTSIRPA